MFTKLFSSITDSTIWRESDHVRIVWITMLAKADVSGFVWASIPGLADAARVTIDQCLEAINKLRAPDEWSRSKENEGRRIEEVDGGWRLLNYDKYRKIRNMEERREYVRKKVAEHRLNVNNVNKSKQCKQMLTHAEGEVEVEEKKNTRRVFIEPTALEVEEYSKSIGFILDGEYFIDYYKTRGWIAGKSKMKDWRAAVRTWKKNNNSKLSGSQKPPPVMRPSYDDLKQKGVL